MKKIFICFLLIAGTLSPVFAAATSGEEELKGKWSGDWKAPNGIPEAMTIEFVSESLGHLSGKFLSPAAMDFTRVSFDPKTQAVTLEAIDAKSGKHYKLDGKIHGTELKGTLDIDNVKGDLILIKWTFFPH